MELSKMLIKNVRICLRSCTQRCRDSVPQTFYYQKFAQLCSVLLHNPGLKLPFIFIISLGILSIEALALGIDPLAVRITEAPGAASKGSIVLSNEHSEPITVKVTVRDESLKPLRERFPDWLTLEPREVTIAPKGTADLSYNVEIPQAALGQFVARISFVENPASIKPQAKIGFQMRLSIYLTATVKGTEVYASDVHSARWVPAKRKYLEVMMKNTGNVWIKPKGQCLVINKATGVSAGTPLLINSKFPLYAGRAVDLDLIPEDALEPGEYQAHVSLKFPDGTQFVAEPLDFTVPETVKTLSDSTLSEKALP